MHNINIFYVNIYIEISTTCFDTFASSSGRSKVVHHYSYEVSIILKFR